MLSFFQENELVVHKALQKVGSKFELEKSLPEWTCRGLPLFSGGKHIEQCTPVRRLTCLHHIRLNSSYMATSGQQHKFRFGTWN